MPLFKHGQFVDDPWREIAEGEDVPPSGHVILTLDWWRAERAAFDGSNVALGLRIEPGTAMADFGADLHRFALIAVSFPKFTDGRGFSLARLLREREGFRGEIRATGEVLLDQIQAMVRCGFDAFDIKDPATLEALQAGRTFGLSEFYQRANGDEAATALARGWRRF